MSADPVICSVCGKDDGFGPPQELPRACSPCRAELTQKVLVSLSRHTRPHHVAERSNREAQSRVGDEPREKVALDWVRLWGDALDRAAETALALHRALSSLSPDAEAVADAVSGPWGPVRLESVAPDPDVLIVCGLSPARARRLAEIVPGARGPELSPTALAHYMDRREEARR